MVRFSCLKGRCQVDIIIIYSAKIRHDRNTPVLEWLRIHKKLILNIVNTVEKLLTRTSEFYL